MNKILCVALSLLLTPGYFYAQSNYKKANVVLLNQQRLDGYIDYKEWSRNPSSFSFKNGDGQRVLSTKEVALFTIDTLETYERNVFTAKGSGKVRNISDIRANHDYKAQTDTVFLRLITQGNLLNLYVYDGMESVRYFVKVNKTGGMQELAFDEYLNEDDQTKIESSNTYKGQLTIFANDAQAQNKAKVLHLLPNFSYDEKDLTKVVNLLNGATPQKHSAYVVKPFAGLFLQRSDLSYSGDFALADGASINSSYRPGVNIGLDFYNNYNIKKYKVRLEGSFSSAHFTADKVVESSASGIRGYNHSFDQYNITFAPQFIMNIYNATTLKVNVGVGLASIYSIYANNEYLTSSSQYGIDRTYVNNFEFSKFAMGLPLRAGVTLRKFDMYAKYNLLLSNNTHYVNYSATIQSFQLGVNYLF